MKNVSSLGEKELVNLIIRKFNSDYLGDDACILDNQYNDLIFTSDMLIESHHLPKSMTPKEIGFKIVTVNISDIAAMGAEPVGFLLNIAVPKTMEVKTFEGILDGVKEACKDYDVLLLGGDTNEADEIILSGTGIGKIEKNKSIMKNTANVGDLIGLTGKIGHAALGFKLLHENIDTEYSKSLKSEILKPKARLKEGRILKDYVSSLTDITDGLAEELYEMKRKDIGFKLYFKDIPIDEEYFTLVKQLDLDLNELLFHFGEDFELVFTINKNNLKHLKDLDYYIIGEVTSTGLVELVKDGDISIIKRKGYQHLK